MTASGVCGPRMWSLIPSGRSMRRTGPPPGRRMTDASKAIYCARTTDFALFSAPELLYRKEDTSVIDSAIYQEDGIYEMFLKSDANPERIILLSAPSLDGPGERVHAFDSEMGKLEAGQYEAPTAMRLEDGRWCLFLDYYGVPGAGQGYVPFVAPSLKSGAFVRSDRAFSFPYGFKHGTIPPP